MIEVSHLTKRYGDHTAVADLSFTVADGQIYGFLGPNGAGKSTTMNMITGCIAATEGQITIDGHDIFEDAAEAKKQIGYLPEIPPLYPDMTPREYLQFVAQAKQVARSDIDAQVAHAISVTQIADVQNRLIKHLSKGYKQRVGIAQALLGNPKIIILDEPTVGLDPLQIIEIRDLIRDLGKAHTVILSSHILSEIQAVCDNILIISKGKLVACDTTENLQELFAGNRTLSLTVKATAEEVHQILDGLEGVAELRCTPLENGLAEVQVVEQAEQDLAEPVFNAFADFRRPILRMNEVHANLEDVFIELIDENQRAAVPEEAVPAAPEAAQAEPEEEVQRDAGNL
ncbi:MAG: ABC transporter ATP-binding protein [Oscillospiraceae bacterium]|nr:ABC transporter ATP-binding protein [Oscillospiraceae bacterium]